MKWVKSRAAIAPTIGLAFCAADARANLPRPAHVVIVVDENHSSDEILGPNSDAPFIRSLAAEGALFTNSHGIAHPSQPNYLGLFSGSTQGVSDDGYPDPMTSPNLGAQLIAAGHSFVGYSEGLPAIGSLVETASTDDLNRYVHKHNPWANWQADSPSGNQLPPSVNQPFTSFPTNFKNLPTVSFVIPDEQHDMHDGTIAQGDQWLCTNLGSLEQQLAASNTLLIVTFDEDDDSSNDINLISTIMVGKMVKPGIYPEEINHLNVLRTVESFYGLRGIADAANVSPITDAFYSSLPVPIPEPTSFALFISGTGYLVRRCR